MVGRPLDCSEVRPGRSGSGRRSGGFVLEVWCRKGLFQRKFSAEKGKHEVMRVRRSSVAVEFVVTSGSEKLGEKRKEGWRVGEE